MADGGVADNRDDELFAQLYPALRRFAGVVRPVEEDAGDLVQDAVVRALPLRPLSEYEDPATYENHIRQISFGVQEQSGTFTCAIAFGSGSGPRSG